MAFDGFTLKAVVQELQSYLIGGKITKVYQPTSDEVILGIYSNGKNYALVCNTSFSFYSLHLTTNSKPNPISAPSFCMLLRKYLIGFKIKNIFMTGLERIAIIELEGYNELNDLVSLKFIVELMGKHSNIILVNQENRIIDSLKHLSTFSGSYRTILPGSIYSFPELNKIELINYNYHNSINEQNNNSLSDYFINTFAGVSKTLLNFSISNLEISDNLTNENFQKLFTYLKELLHKIEMLQVNCINFENDYTLNICEKNSPLQVNFFLDDYYFKKEQLEEFIQYRNSLLTFVSKKVKKVSKKLDVVDEKIEECLKIDEYKLYGELLTNNLYKLDKFHTDHIMLENYYEENKLINIPLDISLSPSDNAKKYFKKYHKLKNTIDLVTIQKTELEKEINYLESIVYELQLAKTTKDLDYIYQEIDEANLLSRKVNIKKVNKSFNLKEKAHQNTKNSNNFLSYIVDGFTVLVGRNNKENDYLTMKIAKQNDIWFHVKNIQGSHIILVVNHKEPSQEIINKIAAICAYYSKANQSSNVPVDYTLAKYVKKPSKSKPGMVIYTNQKTVNVQPNLHFT